MAESNSESNDVQSTERRQFFKNVFLVAGAGIFAQFLSKKAFAAIKSSKSPNVKSYKSPACSGSAKNLHYVNNLAAALKAHKIKKTARKAGAKTWTPLEQRCANCMFFGKNQGKTVPTCALMAPNCGVSPEGSCTDWQPKA